MNRVLKVSITHEKFINRIELKTKIYKKENLFNRKITNILKCITSRTECSWYEQAFPLAIFSVYTKTIL